MAFKQDDIVECIDDYSARVGGKTSALTKGKYYVCQHDSYQSTISGKFMVEIISNDGYPSSWYVERFKLISTCVPNTNTQQNEPKEIDYLQIAREVCGGY